MKDKICVGIDCEDLCPMCDIHIILMNLEWSGNE